MPWISTIGGPLAALRGITSWPWSCSCRGSNTRAQATDPGYDRRVRLPRAIDLRRSPRNADFGELQESFLVSAVATILVIRTQLWLTNYPQLGGGGLHIAHLLYGGIFMVLAIGLLVTFLGRSPRFPAAVIGGGGFGFFIDELGKFITSDNNYFFEPPAALIYLVFVGLFLLSRSLQRRRGLSPAERLSNAIDLIGEAARRDFDENEKRRALEFLEGADPEHPLVAPVRRLISEFDAIPAPAPSRLSRWTRSVRDRYRRLIEKPWFRPLIAWVFGLWALLSAAAILELVFSVGIDLGGARSGFGSDSFSQLTFINIASLCSTAVSGVLVLVGLRRWQEGDRLEAYQWFDRALLVSIFLTRVFSFVESQFGACFGVALDLFLLVTLRYAAQQEQRMQREASASVPLADAHAELAI